MNILGKVFLFLAGLATAPLAAALSLGDITGNGAVGERLDAWVPLYLAPAERNAITAAELLPDVFAQRVADDPALNDIRATVEHLTTGSFIHLQSSTPIMVDRLQFRLRVVSASSAVVSRYEVRLLRTRGARVTPDIIARSPTTRADASVTAAAVRSDKLYGPVRPGESLWTIARRLARGDNVQQMMKELHALNPTAFIGGDVDRLRAGVTLTMPTSATLPTSSERASNRAVGAAIPAATDDNALGTTEESVTRQDASTQSADALDVMLAGEVVGTATPAAKPLAATARDLISRDAALTAKLAALDTKFAAIRARYGQATSHKSNGVVLSEAPAIVTQKNLQGVQAPNALPQSSPAVAPAVIAAAPVSAAVTRQPTSNPVKFEPTPVPARTDVGPFAKWAAYAIAALAAGALGFWAVGALGRVLASRRTRSAVESGRSADADRKADVARKAENRIRMESEIRGLLDRKSHGKPVAEAAPAPARLEITVEPTPVSTLEQTLDVLPPSSLTGSPERDREVAIDANISHGRYAEAEALLRDVIGAHARNFQAKLRLAEVYYITEQIERFAEVATDIKDHHRPDLTDEEWQRVVRMGKIIAPDLVLFSGPKAVGKRA